MGQRGTVVAILTFMVCVTLSELRRIIREEVDRCVRRSAGLVGPSWIGRSMGGDGLPPPGLGDEEADEYDEEELIDGQGSKGR